MALDCCRQQRRCAGHTPLNCIPRGDPIRGLSARHVLARRNMAIRILRPRTSRPLRRRSENSKRHPVQTREHHYPKRGDPGAIETGPLRKWTSRTRRSLFDSIDFTPLEAINITAGIPKLKGSQQSHAFAHSANYQTASRPGARAERHASRLKLAPPLPSRAYLSAAPPTTSSMSTEPSSSTTEPHTL